MVQKQREYLQSSKQLLTFAQQKTFSKFEIMKRKVFILLLNLLFCLSFTMAQEPAKSQLHQRAEAESQKKRILKNTEKEIADMVVTAAQKVVGTQSGAKIDRSLYDEFLVKAGEKQ